MNTQLFGTRFSITIGNYQLRIGMSLENQGEEGTCSAADSPMYVGPEVRRPGDTRLETAS